MPNTPATLIAAMARRTKLTVHGLPGRAADEPFTCYPIDAAQEADWVARYRAMPGVTVAVERPEDR